MVLESETISTPRSRLLAETPACKGRKTFQVMLAEVRITNVYQIRNKAEAANRLAKTLVGRHRRRAYAIKTKAVGRLVS